MTKIIPIRLNKAEIKMLLEILSSDKCECENRSEWFRLLLHREYNKRKGLGIPKLSFQTANRVGGRPPAPIPRFARSVIRTIPLPFNMFSHPLPEVGGASRAERLHKATGRDISARRPRSKRLVKHSGIRNNK